MKEALNAFDRIGGAGRAMLAGIAVLTIGAVFYLVMSAAPASYVPAFTNLQPREAGDVQAALASASIPSKLDRAGTVVSVPSSQIDEAKVAVDAAGLTPGGERGYEMLDELGVGATEFQNNITLQRALEGELATQVESIAGIDDATVNLAVPKQTVFLQDAGQPTASVLVDLSGAALPASAVSGIQRLIAGKVPGLTYTNVVVTNERGMLISATGEDAIGGLAANRLQTEAAVSNQLEAKAQNILDQMLGVGMATVSVNAKLDLDKVKSEQVEYGDEGTEIKTAKESETLKGTGGATGGPAGTDTNIPGYAAGSGGGSSDYQHTQDEILNGVDHTVTSTERAGGDTTNIYAAVAFSQPKPAKGATGPVTSLTPDMEAAAAAVQTALGISDTSVEKGTNAFETSLSSVSFTETAAAATATAAAAAGGGGGGGGPIGMVTGYLRPAMAVLGVLVLLFLVRRSLSRRQALLGSAEARWMPTLQAPPIPIDDISLPGGPTTAELEAANKKALQGRIEEIATQRPGDVAQQLRGWLAEES